MRRVAFINEKGGTGKTTLAVNVGAWLARERRRRVLVVDGDTQGHCGKSLGVDVRQVSRTLFDVMVDPAVEAAQAIVPTAIENLFLLPSNKALADLPLRLAADSDREHKLERKLAALAGFDVVLFDAPPSMGLMTTNIVLATREIVIPVALTYLALDGCAEIVSTVQRMAVEHRRPDLTVSLVVPTLYRRTALADAILDKLRSYFPDTLCATALGYSVKVDEAQSHGRTIWEYAPASRGAEMLAAIARELDARAESRPRA